MDLATVSTVRSPHTRDDVGLGESEALLGGGSWLYSEPQTHLTGLVDLTTMAWPALTITGDSLSVAATCTFAEIAGFQAPDGWMSHPLFRQCCTALLGSFKVWSVATVGGNICLGLPAGPMTSLAVALEADAIIWNPDGTDRRADVADLVTGVQTTSLRHGELLRSLEFPARTLRARTGYRQIALSPLGRSGTLVIARLDDDGAFVVTVTAGTPRPERLRFDAVPTAAELEEAVRSIGDWYDDAHGAPDWREAMTVLLAEQLRVELAG